jgi:hypothetical protein
MGFTKFWKMDVVPTEIELQLRKQHTGILGGNYYRAVPYYPGVGYLYFTKTKSGLETGKIYSWKSL